MPEECTQCYQHLLGFYEAQENLKPDALPITANRIQLDSNQEPVVYKHSAHERIIVPNLPRTCIKIRGVQHYVEINNFGLTGGK